MGVSARLSRRTESWIGFFESEWRLLLALVLALYAAGTVLHGLRRFWYDEIFTYYVCRLPSLAESLRAVRQGADLNPPLLYILTRFCHSLLGTGELATRVPEILSYLGMMLALFRFVSRYGSPVPALVALTLPMATGAFYYASEARPHAIALGFTALAAVAWQSATRGEHRRRNLVMMSLGLAGALLSHCYAPVIFAPLVLAEGVRTLNRRRFDLAVLASFCAPLPLVLTYAPLFHTAQKISTDNMLMQPGWNAVTQSYLTVLGPGLGIVLACLAAAAVALAGRGGEEPQGAAVPAHELALGAGFLLAPVLGVLVSVAVTKIFYPRYGLAAVMGLSLLTGTALSARWWASRIAAALLWILLIGIFVHDQVTLVRGPGGTAPAKAETGLELSKLDPVIPLVVSSGLSFVELTHYGPPAHAARLYFLEDPKTAIEYTGTDVFEHLHEAKRWLPLGGKIQPYAGFLDAHPRFFMLLFQDFPTDWLFRKLADDGCQMAVLGRAFTSLGRALVMEVRRPATPAPPAPASARVPGRP